MNKRIDEFKQIISSNIYMTIATATHEGKPWISPVFFAFDSKYNLYWVSNKDSKHSSLIRINPQVAIVVFDSRANEGEGDGVYFEAIVEELNDDENILQAIEILNKRISKDEFKIKNIDEVTGTGIWRIYKATPDQISKLTEGEIVNGQYIDKRVDININENI
jgi:uncharacterized protein YhbP (UPF0306 family)